MQNIKDIAKKSKRLSKKKGSQPLTKKEKQKIKDVPFLKGIKPKGRMYFFSDYFKVDEGYGTVLSVFHTEGSDDKLGFFWGIQLTPRDLGQGVEVHIYNHVSRVSESWVQSHQSKAEQLLKTSASQVQSDGSFQAKQQYSKKQQSLMDIASEVGSGSSYLRVALRILLKAPTLNALDDAKEKINRQYKDRFETVYAESYTGEQKQELGNLYRKVDSKHGRNFMFTSSEYAGSYSLVTHGIEDPTGEYVGTMQGDVNNSAIIMDLDAYDSHVVIASKSRGQTLSKLQLNGEKGIDVWGAKLGMSALMNNKKVVHLVLNGANVSDIGVDLSDMTANVRMDGGDINFLEMFGSQSDELGVFASHVEKILLMSEQISKPTEQNAEIIRGSLRDIMKNFYIDSKMWVEDAQNNRDRLRIVDLPHSEIPKLPILISYFEQAYQAEKSSRSPDQDMVHAYNVLRQLFKSMLSTNGDLFNTETSDVIDRSKLSQRVVYDFSSLKKRGQGVMMAQFVNALGFSVGNLVEGDVLILHGADMLSPQIKDYVRDQMDLLQAANVRIVFLYRSIEKMIDDKSFNQFDQADYTLIGPMSDSVANKYQHAIAQDIPQALKQMLVRPSNIQYYLRRGYDNLIFNSDIQLGI